MCVVAGITPSQEMSKEASVCDPVPLDSEDPLFMLYTSGSTGKPKGILHTQAGYLLMAGLTQQVLTYILFPSAHLIALSLSSSLSLSLLLPLSLSPSLSLLLSPSLSLSMYLTIVLVMYLRVWLTLGWITGHSYVVYGPLSNGGTTVLFESTPVYPGPGQL